MDAAILLRSRPARNDASDNHCRYDPFSSWHLSLEPAGVIQFAAAGTQNAMKKPEGQAGI